MNFLRDIRRPIYVFPDCDGQAQWEQKAAAISELIPGIKIAVNPFAHIFGEGKQDLADIVFEGFFAYDCTFLDNFITYVNLYKPKTL